MAGKPTIANVSFFASHDTNASRQADKIARELNVTNTPRTIYSGARLVQTLDKGTTE